MDKSKAIDIDDLDMLPDDEILKLNSTLESGIVFKTKSKFNLFDSIKLWRLKRACGKVKYEEPNFSMEIPEELKQKPAKTFSYYQDRIDVLEDEAKNALENYTDVYNQHEKLEKQCETYKREIDKLNREKGINL